MSPYGIVLEATPSEGVAKLGRRYGVRKGSQAHRPAAHALQSLEAVLAVPSVYLPLPQLTQLEAFVHALLDWYLLTQHTTHARKHTARRARGSTRSATPARLCRWLSWPSHGSYCRARALANVRYRCASWRRRAAHRTRRSAAQAEWQRRTSQQGTRYTASLRFCRSGVDRQ